MSSVDEEREAQKAHVGCLWSHSREGSWNGNSDLQTMPLSPHYISVTGCHNHCYVTALLSYISPCLFLPNQKPLGIVHNQFSNRVCVAGGGGGVMVRRGGGIILPKMHLAGAQVTSLLSKPPHVLCPGMYIDRHHEDFKCRPDEQLLPNNPHPWKPI